jgi:Fe-S-cluster containining protein
MSETKERLPPGSPCTNCGKCCTNANYMGTLSATKEDVDRWQREGRHDILRFVFVLGLSGRNGMPYADLWVDRDHDDRERLRCPFVRKVKGQNRYLCKIYETRPQVCKDYVPWSEDAICEVV